MSSQDDEPQSSAMTTSTTPTPNPQTKPICHMVDWKGRPYWSTELHKMVGNDLDDDGWSNVIHRASAHPEEASMQGPFFGQTVLHLACYRFPPEDAVRALLKACPESASIQNCDGETPLHIAVGSATEEVMTLIMEAREDAVCKVDKHGDTPLHLACALGVSLEIIRKMVSICPKLVTQPNNNGFTPLFFLPKDYQMATSRDDIARDGPYFEDWEKITFLIRVALFGDVDNNTNRTKVVHAATRCPCPRAFLDLVVRLFPEQLSERDECGDFPLSIAAAADLFEEPEDIQDVIELDDFGESAWSYYAEDGMSSSTQVMTHSSSETTTKKKQQSVVEFLVSQNPRTASMCDGSGRLPLAIAVENGKGWYDGIKSLLYASPRALHTRDTKTHMHPFMIAAVEDNSSHTTVYELIRALPELVSVGIPLDREPAENHERHKEEKVDTAKRKCEISSLNQESVTFSSRIHSACRKRQCLPTKENVGQLSC